jgi:WD40 repeat protein
MLLLLSLICKKATEPYDETPFTYQPDLNQLSDQFWSTVNPNKETTWLQIQPPHLFIFDADRSQAQSHLDYLQHLYHVKSMAVRYTIDHHPTLFRSLILSSLETICVILLRINIPALILCLVMLAIITWMTPKWRKQWLVPLLIHCFNQFFLTVFKYVPIKRWYSHVKHVDPVVSSNVRTLMHHVSDIQSLDGKQNLVSCGHDGRVVLWSTTSWTARLDLLHLTRAGHLVAMQHKKKKTMVALTKQKPRMVKIESTSKWIAVVYDDTIRVWNSNALVQEISVQGRVVALEFMDEQLVTAHKTGLLHEWDMNTGECVQSVHVGRAITLLHVVKSTWVVTASKDGCVQCWERKPNDWTLAYSIQLTSAVTSIATDVSVVGIGVLVTGCSDGSVKVWHFETGELLSSFMAQLEDSEEDENEDVQAPSIIQVAVTKYDQIGVGHNNGFLVASSTVDKVHAWRLTHNAGSCSQCSYRKRNRHRKTSISSASNDEGNDVFKTRRYVHEEPAEEMDHRVQLKSTFLGKIDQMGGRSVVFCDKLLAGVRRRRDGDWEAWCATLQHYEPEHHQWRIPVETYDLHTESVHDDTQKSYLKSTLANLFKRGGARDHTLMKYKGIHEEENKEEEEELEAIENLPFASIRHVIPLAGSGLACDFGNFIKLVYFENRPSKKLSQAKKLDDCQCVDIKKKKKRDITRMRKITEFSGSSDYISFTPWS